MSLLRAVRALHNSTYALCRPISFQSQVSTIRPSTFLSSSLMNFVRSFSSSLNSSSLLKSSQCTVGSLYQVQQKRYKRFPTVKRRKTHPLRWWAKQNADPELHNELSRHNQKLLSQVVEAEHQRKLESSPLQLDPNILTGKTWTPQSKRTGLIARKLGVIPFWLKNGKRITTTLLQVVDNHVINYHDVNETKEKSIYQDRWKTDGFATVTVGAESCDPTRFTSSYLGLFNKAGVMPKRKLAKFVITEDAALPAGTPLHVCHFQVGQYVDVFGRTIDRGFEGVVKRWGFKGDGSKHQGATKAHRRGGSISQGRKAGGPMKGRRMAGHMGDERKTLASLQVMRINTKYGLLFIRGQCIPGPIGSWVYVFDGKMPEKQFKLDNPPPFPTFLEDLQKAQPEDIYHTSLHVMDQETVIFEETEEEKRAQQRRTGAKLAKVRRK